jgi:hypothetical protein
MPNPLTRSEVVTRNERHGCDVRGCQHLRRGLSKYCIRHRARWQRTGHPEGRSILPKEYANELQRVSHFIDVHRDSPQIVAAVRWLKERWLVPASSRGATPGEHQRARLYRAQIDPLGILKVCGALALFSHLRPRALDDDVRLTIAYGIAVCRLVPDVETKFVPMRGEKTQRKPLGIVARREVGQTLRDYLGVLFHHVARGVIALEERQQQDGDAVRTPFEVAAPPTDSQSVTAAVKAAQPHGDIRLLIPTNTLKA